jgi:hypothetical protein
MTGPITRSLSLLSAACLLLNGASAAVDPIVIQGSKFFYKTNGTQFFIKGVAYQQGVSAGGGGALGGSNSTFSPAQHGRGVWEGHPANW